MEAELASLNLRFSELAETLGVLNFREAREFNLHGAVRSKMSFAELTVLRISGNT